MKVLHLISGGDKGGAKTHMFALLDELCRMCDVTVVCLMRGVFYEEILKREVRTVLLEQKSRFDLSVVGELRRMITEEGFDLLNAHGARANFIAARLVKKTDIPVVTTIHSDYMLDFDSFYKKLIFRSFNIRALKKIKYKIAVSDAFREMLISRGFKPNDLLTVYNGMDFNTPVSPMGRREFAEKYGVPYDEETVYVGIAARFDRVKGVDLFIRAAADVLKSRDNVRFVIAGDGDEKEALAALADELGIADRVHFIGFVKPVYDFLNFIDVNSLTSRSESFPYSILEGALMKKPTVAAAVGGIPKLIIDGETGFTFPPEDHASCAESFICAIDSAGLRKRLGEALYAKASTEFSNRALAEQYLENYRRFIAKSKREKRYDLILSGYYGFGNFGDEIILSTIIRKIREDRPEYEMAVLSKDPDGTAMRFGVDSCSRFGVFGVRKLMRQSRVYVNGGGTLMTDVTSTHSLVYYTSMLNMAKRMGLKTMLLANGIGPFRRPSNERRALKALGRVDVMTLRDKGAYDFIRERLPDARAVLSSDVIFTYCNGSLREKLTASPAQTPFGRGEDYCVISLRDFAMSGPGFENAVANAGRRICEEYGLRALLLPMQYEKDLRVCESTAEKMGGCAAVLPESFKGDRIGVFAHARFVLGMRLHSLMLAAALSVPIVGLSYDIKIDRFVNENGLGDCFDVKTLTEEELYAGISKVADGRLPDSYPLFIERVGGLCEQNSKALFELIDEDREG